MAKRANSLADGVDVELSLVKLLAARGRSDIPVAW
jgi:hypothetical protein